MSFELHGFKVRQATVNAGYTKFFDPPQQDIEVYQVVISASEDCTVRFGGPGAPATPAFPLAKGVPMVLPFSQRGWWRFDGSAEVGVTVATAAPSVSVAILAMFRKE